MMPLPQLLDGLGRGRLEIVQKAFALHHRAFLTEFLRHLSSGANSLADEHVTRMAILLETIMNHSKKCEKYSPFRISVLNATVDHCKTLIQELDSFKVSATSLSAQQKKAVLELLNFHLNHLQNLLVEISVKPEPTLMHEKVVAEVLSHPTSSSNISKHKQSVKSDKNLKAHVHPNPAANVLMNTLSGKSDEDVVRYALLSSDAVAYAEQILLARGGRTSTEVKEFFESVADLYIDELLTLKHMEKAKDVLRNTDRDIWPSLKSIFLNSVDSDIRDYVAIELNSLSLLDAAELDSWKFLILVEGILKDTNLKVHILEDHMVLQKYSEDGNPSHISISSLLNLPNPSIARSSLLTALYIETLNGTLEPMLNKDDCWSYLLTNDHLDILIKWITVSCSETYNSEKTDRLIKFFSSWNVTQDMINLIPLSKSCATTKECLLDLLSKFGLHPTEEINDVHKLLLRAIRTGQIFNKWDESIDRLVVEFCVQCNMPDLLVSTNLKTELELTGWLKFFSHVQGLKPDSPLKKNILECISLSSEYLKMECTRNPRVALASFLLSDQCFRDALNETSSEEGRKRLEIQKHLLESLDCYPNFYSLLSSSSQDSLKKEISLQSLLRQKFSSDSSHLVLKQQSLCSMFRDEQENNEVDFFHESTIHMYGHIEVLDFQYFLKQGRPCHAAMLVLADVIKNYGKPARKLLKKVSMSAHELAFFNAFDRVITASCIAFLEMLGESSIFLRTHLAVISHIVSFKADKVFGFEQKASSFDSLLHQFLNTTGTKSYHEIYDLLQSFLPFDIHKQGLAVQFANLHKLPLPTDFLEHCALKSDWVTFLIFCQIYGYPPETVKKIAAQFLPTALRDHMESFVCRYFLTTRSSLKTLKAPPRSSEPDQSCSKNSEQANASTSSLSSEGTSLIPAVTLSARETLFGVLLTCHNCSDPAEALLHFCIELPCSVLAVFAECYKTSSEAQLIAWLASWLPHKERVNFETWQKNVPWPADIVKSLILRSMEASTINLLSGFQIFIPKHPLVLVLEMIKDFPARDFMRNVNALIKFKDMCENLDRNQEDPWCLSNSYFVLDMGIKLLLSSFNKILCTSHKKQFIEILHNSNISLHPDGSTFDLLKLLSILDALDSSPVQIDVQNYITNSSEEIQLCTERLVSLGFYTEAACISGITFVISEQREKFEKWLETNYQDFKEFCEDCNSQFDLAMINPLEASAFFQECAVKTTTNVDRWRAYYNALKWLQSSDVKNSDVIVLMNKIELDMWSCCLQGNNPLVFCALKEELHDSPLKDMSSKTLSATDIKWSDRFHQCESICEEKKCPKRLIDCLLDIGDLVSASHVHTFFESNHQDLEILLTCVRLAEGSLKIHEIHSNWAPLASVQIGYSDSQSSLSRNSSSGEKELYYMSSENYQRAGDISADKSKLLSIIQDLCKQLKHGKEIGKQLIACFRLSMSNLNLSFSDIIAITDPLKLLRMAMSQTYCGDHSVASDIMVAMRFSLDERAKFLSREIVAAISRGPGHGNVKVYLFWGHDIEQYFPHVLELIPDPARLGSELLKMAGKLGIADKNTPKTVLNTAVELLVRAHDCYAAACHMEGISQILHTVNNFTSVLKTRSEWSLMVRLLTGIQRYTEMNYIFKMLKESDHFEFLLRKDSVKPLGFKLALLDWLRRENTNDTTLLKMTAAHFQMHQQEAELWQKEGNDHLSEVLEHGLINNQKTKNCLQIAMQDYSHASECYLQADMLNHAMACAHQAELVALQLHLLTAHLDGSILQVIMLDSKSVSKLIISTLGFSQALIVSRAYNYRADWAAALFYHCISPGLSCEDYFLSWSSCMELTPSIIQNIAYRLQRTPAITREMSSNMQWLLSHVKDIDVRYKIASELGLKDMVESLLQAPEVAYLKDTVWQSGFKR